MLLAGETAAAVAGTILATFKKDAGDPSNHDFIPYYGQNRLQTEC